MAALMLFFAFSGFAQNATVHNVWVETVNLGDQLNDKGYKVHAKIDVNGMIDKQIKVIAYFYDANKNPVFSKRINPLMAKLIETAKLGEYFKNDKYKAADNQICTSSTSKPIYDNSTYDDFSLFLPSTAIVSYLPYGHATYFVRVRVYDVKNQLFISDSEPYSSFDSFGASWELYAGFAEAKEKSSGSKIENKGKLISASENDGNGFYMCTFVFDSGWEEHLTLTNCIICNGTGKTSCIPCLGMGYTTQYAYPNVYRIPCSSCGGRGFVPCSFCESLGVAMMVTAYNEKLHLQYVDGKISPYYPANGNQTQPSNSNQQIYTQPIPPTYTREKLECPSCHGRKVCKHCGGTGKVERKNGYTGYTEWHDCVMCNGSGTCQACNGKGYYY